jgi:hypothetical protein
MNQDQQYQQQISNIRYFKKKTNYIPTEDGFITSAGNPELAAKYGNSLGANTIKSQDIIEAVKNINLKK